MHARRRQVAAKGGAEFIVGHLAQERHARAEAGGHHAGIGGRTAAANGPLRHGRLEPLDAMLVDQHHPALVLVVPAEKRVVHRGQQIDDGVADAENVETGTVHAGTPRARRRSG